MPFSRTNFRIDIYLLLLALFSDLNDDSLIDLYRSSGKKLPVLNDIKVLSDLYGDCCGSLNALLYLILF